MRFWEEMQTKYGFGDGDATPVGCNTYRTAYILAVNAIAERLGSCVRFVAYDRSGLHNCCLVVPVTAKYAAILTPEAISSGSADYPPKAVVNAMDELMLNAIAEAMELDVDSYVITKVTLSKTAIRDLLKSCKSTGVRG